MKKLEKQNGLKSLRDQLESTLEMDRVDIKERTREDQSNGAYIVMREEGKEKIQGTQSTGETVDKRSGTITEERRDTIHAPVVEVEIRTPAAEQINLAHKKAIQ